MTEENLVKLLNKLGHIPLERNGDWLRTACPLAFLTHVKGRDEHPSCVISISGEKESVVHCFTCGSRVLGDVLHVLNWTVGVSPEVWRFYLENECRPEENEEVGIRDKYELQTKEDKTPVPVPQYILDKLQPLRGGARHFLEGRGISLEVAEKHQLKTYKQGVVFPIRDKDYHTYYLHWRCWQHKYMPYLKPGDFGCNVEWGREDSWFGIEFIDWNRAVIVVEGELDLLRLETLGVTNVIASHGPIGKKSRKLQRLVDNDPPLVALGFDADQSGDRYKENCKRMLKNSIDLDWRLVNKNDPGELESIEEFDKVWAGRPTKKLLYRDKWESIL